MQRIRRLVFIVSPGRRQLYESLTRTFAGDATVQVVMDRRGGERRQRPASTSSERRQKDRRRPRNDVQKSLSQRGYAVVGVVAPKVARRG